MKSKNDFSYGVIPIIKTDTGWNVFLINQFSRIGNNSYWIFPKGHPEGNETPVETAIRELKEETSITADKILSEPTFSLKYSFVFDGIKINKTVTFFIGIVSTRYFKVDEEEVGEGGWYPLEEVDKRLDYKDTKKVFKKAKPFIENL